MGGVIFARDVPTPVHIFENELNFTICSQSDIENSGWIGYGKTYGQSLRGDQSGLGPTAEWTDSPADILMPINLSSASKVNFNIEGYISHNNTRGAWSFKIISLRSPIVDGEIPHDLASGEVRLASFPKYEYSPYDEIIPPVWFWNEGSDINIDPVDGVVKIYDDLGVQGYTGIIRYRGEFDIATLTLSLNIELPGESVTGSFTRSWSGVQNEQMIRDFLASEGLYFTLNNGRGFGENSMGDRFTYSHIIVD